MAVIKIIDNDCLNNYNINSNNCTLIFDYYY